MQSTPSLNVDIAVIGAGTAGMHAFSAARRAGARVVMIDAGPLGTLCARSGCMPSKAVLHAGRRWRTLMELLPGGSAGMLPAGHITPDDLWRSALAIRDELVAGNVRQVERLGGADLLHAAARFVGMDQLELDDGRLIRARAFVVATGSQAVKPAELAASLGDRLITTDELFTLPHLPASVAVMGLGAIGLEMSLALSRLGVSVAAAGRSAVLANMADPQVAAEALAYFAQQLPLAVGHKEIQVQREGDGIVMRAGGIEHYAQYLLAALGRTPRVQGLQWQQAGVRMDERQRPVMAPGALRCADSLVFLAGDAAPGPALMHEAGHEGTLAAHQALRALGDVRWADLPLPPRTTPLSIVFSDPDLVQVGLRFDQLPADAVIGTVEGHGSGRSRLMQAPHHLLRLYAERSTGRLLGASIFCAGGEHLAHELAWAVQRGETVESMLELPYYHPTLEEMIDTALRDMRRQLRAA